MTRPVPRETHRLLSEYETLVRVASQTQNLVSSATLDIFQDRHVADSLQLLAHSRAGTWLDIGSGAGLPGMVIAIAEPDRPVLLVEPRAKRAAFLRETAATLNLPRVIVHQLKVERVEVAPVQVISARAVATLPALFAMAGHLTNADTVWLLPRGRNARNELAEARALWHGSFSLVPSKTDAESAIVVATDVRLKGKAR